ncbi:MAG: molybdopterin molybdenumtransferase MoeA, partial [Flavisolibacter sp.]
VLTCFYEYVVPAIQQMMGINTDDNSKQLKLASDYQKKQGLTHFLKGKVSGNEVELLNAQESFQMGSFAIADCLICLDEEKTDFQKGELVEVHLI